MSTWESLVSGGILKSIKTEKSRSYITSKELASNLPTLIDNGWEKVKDYKNPKYILVRQEKQGSELFEDSLWVMCANMGFTSLNGDDEFSICFDKDNPERERHFDVFAADEETVLLFECLYERIDRDKLRERGYPAGSVVIIGQGTFLKSNQWVYEFYRTVLIYWGNKAEPNRAWFVEAPNEEWPDRPPWAETVGHEGEAKDTDFYFQHLHWVTGEVVEPIETWWMKEERERREKHEHK